MQNLKKKIKIVIYWVWIHSKYEINDDSYVMIYIYIY